MLKKVFYLLMVCLLFSCDPMTLDNKDSDEQQKEENNEDKPQTFVIGANIYNFHDTYMNEKIKPELLSVVSTTDYTLDIVNSESNHQLLLSQIDDFIEENVDALLINLVDPNEAQTVINKAKEADTPLILYMEEPTDPTVMATYDKVWYVGPDIKTAGIEQGKLILDDWNTNKNVWDKNSDDIIQYIMIQGSPDHPHAVSRTYESVKVLTDAGITVEELDTFIDPNGYWSKDHGYSSMQDAFNRFENIELVISNNDGMAFGALNAMDVIGEKLPIYSVDMLEETLTEIESDRLNGTVLLDWITATQAIIDITINSAKETEDIVEGTDLTLEENGKYILTPYIGINKDNYLDHIGDFEIPDSVNYQIGANIYTDADNYMNSMVKPKFEAYATSIGSTITVVSSENNQDTLNSQVDQFISDNMDFLIINLVDTNEAITIINKAQTADLPLILYGWDAPPEEALNSYDKVWYIGSDDNIGGVVQGEMILEDWKNNSFDKNSDGIMQYIMIKGDDNHPASIARSTKSIEVITNDGVQVEELAAGTDPNGWWSMAHGEEFTLQSLNAAYGSDIEVIISNNDGMALGAITAMEQEGVNIPIYGFDMVPDAVTKITEDKLNGTVFLDTKMQAYLAITIGINSVSDKNIEENLFNDFEDDGKTILLPFHAVNKVNYSRYQ